MDQVGDFQREHFNGVTCQVEGLNQDIREGLGIDIRPEFLIRLVGAPSNSIVRVSLKKQWSDKEIPDGEEVPPGILVVIENKFYYDEPAELVIFLDGLVDKIGIYLKLIVFKDNSSLRGIAGHMINVMARAAAEMAGASRLKLWAAGGLLWEDMNPGVRWGGYMAWPKYGFDAVVPSPTRALFPHFPYYPAGLSSCVKVSDVLSLRGGRDFWRIAGDGSYMNFDLAPNSKSRKILDSFLEDWRR